MMDKKTIEQFLKPNKPKLLIFIIIFLLSVTIGARFWEQQYMPSFGPGDKLPPVWTYCYVSYFYPLWPVSLFMSGSMMGTEWAKNELGRGIITLMRAEDFSGRGIRFSKYFLIFPPLHLLIINLLYWYFLSCLIIFIYDKLYLFRK